MRDAPDERPAAAGGAGERAVLRRVVARVVFVDDADAVLLLSGRDPSVAGAREFWFTPGGGAEAGETLEAAAAREVHEEVGHSVGGLGPVVWQRSSTFDFDNTSFAQEESFFVVRTARFEARPVAWTDFESRAVTGWRWWPVAELAAADVAVYPPGLGGLVEEWLRAGPPGRPRRIE